MTFWNQASFEDFRTDGKLHRLEVNITADGSEVPYFSTIYIPPYSWAGKPIIDVLVPDDGEDEHRYDVVTVYSIYVDDGNGFELECRVYPGGTATVYSIEVGT